MPRIVADLPAIAQREMESCCKAGLSAEATRARLGELCGFWMASRTLAKRMHEWRKKNARREERLFELREIGKGMALVNSGIGVANEICGAVIPTGGEST
jgi:hypothetical protein